MKKILLSILVSFFLTSNAYAVVSLDAFFEIDWESFEVSGGTITPDFAASFSFVQNDDAPPVFDETFTFDDTFAEFIDANTFLEAGTNDEFVYGEVYKTIPYGEGSANAAALQAIEFTANQTGELVFSVDAYVLSDIERTDTSEAGYIFNEAFFFGINEDELLEDGDFIELESFLFPGDDELYVYDEDFVSLEYSLFFNEGDYGILFAGGEIYAAGEATQPVPEPLSMFMLGFGGLIAVIRKKIF